MFYVSKTAQVVQKLLTIKSFRSNVFFIFDNFLVTKSFLSYYFMLLFAHFHPSLTSVSEAEVQRNEESYGIQIMGTLPTVVPSNIRLG